VRGESEPFDAAHPICNLLSADTVFIVFWLDCLKVFVYVCWYLDKEFSDSCERFEVGKKTGTKHEEMNDISVGCIFMAL